MKSLCSRLDHWRVRWLATPIALALLASLTTAQEVVHRYHPNPPASLHGHRYDDLFWLITRDVTICLVAVLFPLVIVLIRDRAGPGKKAKYDRGTSLRDKYFTAIVSASVFFFLDAIVLVTALQDLREAVWAIPEPTEQEEVFQVEVLAQQWAWNFRTAGIDNEFGTADDIVTIGQLAVPNDTPVVFNLASKDVIHAFFVPDMRVKRDANPGAVNSVWFQPIVPGTYDIYCAELCGFAHYQMNAYLHVLEQDVFSAWEVEASTLALAEYDEEDTEAHWAWDWKE